MTTAKLTNYAQHANQTVTVSSSAELRAAIAQLDTSGGGTILVDGNGGPYSMRAFQVGGSDSPIKITSANGNAPARFSEISIDQSSHITLTGIHVEDTQTTSASQGTNTDFDMRVFHSNHIEIGNITMDGGATDFLNPNAGAHPGMRGIKFESVQDSVFIDNTLVGHFDAIEMIKVSGMVISGNDISATQGDGIRGGGWKHVDITDNNIHDFLGVAYEYAHSDMIQLWTTWPHNYQNEDIEISGNFLDAGNGVATQSMLLQAEAFSNPNHPNYGVFNTDVRVHDNLIYNGHFHGITLSNTQGAQIYNNTVLWNEDAANSDVTGQTPTSQPPTIRLMNTPGSTVQDNVAQQILVNGSFDHGDNFYLNYTNPNDSHYAYDHVGGIANGGNANLSDLQFTSSTLDGNVGSPSFSWSGGGAAPTSGASSPVPSVSQPAPDPIVLMASNASQAPGEFGDPSIGADDGGSANDDGSAAPSGGDDAQAPAPQSGGDDAPAAAPQSGGDDFVAPASGGDDAQTPAPQSGGDDAPAQQSGGDDFVAPTSGGDDAPAPAPQSGGDDFVAPVSGGDGDSFPAPAQLGGDTGDDDITPPTPAENEASASPAPADPESTPAPIEPLSFAPSVVFGQDITGADAPAFGDDGPSPVGSDDGSQATLVAAEVVQSILANMVSEVTGGPSSEDDRNTSLQDDDGSTSLQDVVPITGTIDDTLPANRGSDEDDTQNGSEEDDTLIVAA